MSHSQQREEFVQWFSYHLLRYESNVSAIAPHKYLRHTVYVLLLKMYFFVHLVYIIVHKET